MGWPSVRQGFAIGWFVEEHQPLPDFFEYWLALFDDLGQLLSIAVHGFIGEAVGQQVVETCQAFVEVGDLRLQFREALDDEFVVHILFFGA